MFLLGPPLIAGKKKGQPIYSQYLRDFAEVKTDGKKIHLKNFVTAVMASSNLCGSK